MSINIATMLRGALLVATVVCTAVDVHAQDDLAPSSSIQIQRILVPSERIEDAVAPGDRYRPTDPDEFERLLAARRATSQSTGAPSAAFLVASVYNADFRDHAMLEGTASLRFESPSPALQSIAVKPFNLAVSNLRATQPAPADALAASLLPQPTTLGFHADGSLAVDLRGRRNVEMDWSLRGQTISRGRSLFEIEIPPSPRSTISIRSTPSVVLSCDEVAIQRTDRDEAIVWQIDASGQRQLTVRARDTEDVEIDTATVASQSITYDFSPRALEVTADLILAARAPSRTTINVVYPPTLEIVSATFGNRRLDLTRSPTAPDGMMASVVALPANAPAGGAIVLSGLQPFDVGSTVRLPTIQIENVSWQQGDAELRIQEPLRLERLSLDACRQTGMGPLDRPLRGEFVEIQLFDPSAAIDVEVAWDQETSKWTDVTNIEVSDSQWLAHTQLECDPPPSSNDRIAFRIAPGWTVSSLVADPPEHVVDWHVDTDAQRSQSLVIDRGANSDPNGPFSLHLSATRIPPSASGDFPLDEFLVVRHPTAALASRVLAFAPNERFTWALENSRGLAPVDPSHPLYDQLTRQTRTAELPLAYLVAESSAADVRLDQRMPQIAAETLVDLRVDGDHLVETYHFDLSAPFASVDSVRIHFSTARDSDVRWTKGTQQTPPLDAMRIQQQQADDRNHETRGETWNVPVALAEAGDTRIVAQRRTPLAQVDAVALASVVDATRQTGFVYFQPTDDRRWDLETAVLTRLPGPPASTPDTYAGGTTYAYHPTRDTAHLPAEVLRLVATDAARTSTHVWNLHTTTRYHEPGELQHVAVLQIENHGAKQLTLTNPTAAEWTDVAVDGVRVKTSLDGPSVRVPLDTNVRFPVLMIGLRSQADATAVSFSIAAPRIELDVPILSNSWSVLLPSYLELEDPASERAYQADRTKATLAVPYSPTASDRDRALPIYTAIIDRLRSAESSASAAPVRWADVVAAADRAATANGDALAVDIAALRQARIEPRTPVVLEYANAEELSAVALLSASGLTLRVQSNRFVLTDAESALDGPQADARFRPASIWCTRAHMPWPVAESASALPIDAEGWRHVEVARTEVQDRTIRVVDSRRTRLFGWMLVTVGLFVAWTRAASRWLMVTLFVASIPIALLAAEPYLPMIHGAMLGIAAALLGTLFRSRSQRRTNQAPTSPKRNPTIRVSTATTLLVACLLAASHIGTTSRALAQELDDAAPRQQPFRVLIPVDENRQPTGERVFVPEALDRLLRQENTAQPEALVEPVIREAEYQATLARDPFRGEIVVIELSMRYEFERPRVAGRAAIALDRASLRLLPDGATLDGRPIEVEWSPSGDRLYFDPGTEPVQSFELRVRPAMLIDADGKKGFRLAIPTVAASSLTLLRPPAVANVEVPTARGRLAATEDGRQIQADLGPANDLRILWSDSEMAQESPGMTSVTSAHWFTVRPGSVTLETRLNYDVGRQQTSHLELNADPRLTLIAAAIRNEGGTDDQPRISRDTRDRLHIRLDRPRSGQFQLALSFQLAASSGIGNLSIPRVATVDPLAAPSLVALTVDDLLDFQVDHAEEVQTVDVRRFIAEWSPDGPSDDALPQRVYQVDSVDAIRSVATRPRKPQVDAAEEQSIRFSSNRAAIEYHAEMETRGGFVFQHQFQVPRNLIIEEVTVRTGNVAQKPRWSRNQTGILTTFFPRPLAGNYTVDVEAWQRIVDEEPSELPTIALREATPQSSRIHVYRSHDVRLEFVEMERLQSVALPTTTAQQTADSRLEATFRAETTDFLAKFVLRDNRPRIDVRQHTTLTYEDTWSATVDVALDVADGLLDSVGVLLPSEWSTNVVLDPPMQFTIAANEDDASRLEISLPESVDSSIRFSLHLQRRPNRPDPLQAPRVRIVGRDDAPYTRVEHTVTLPAVVAGEPVHWRTRGLDPVNAHAQGDAATDSFIFRATTDDESATMLPTGRQNTSARVLLADVTTRIRDDGSYLAVSRFHLLPGGASTGKMRIPDSVHLLALVNNGTDLPLPSAADEFAVVRFNSSVLPQCVEVLYEIPVAINGHPSRKESPGPTHYIETPFFAEFPAERTIWTLQSDLPQIRLAMDDAPDVSQAILARIRLESLLALANTSNPNAPTATDAPWYDFFRRRVRESRATAAAFRQLAESPAQGQALENAVQQADDFLLAPTASPLPSTAASTPDDIASRLNNSLATPNAIPRSVIFDDAVTELPVVAAPQPRVAPAWRSWPFAMASVFVVLVGMIAARGYLTEELEKAPLLPVALTALAVWLLVVPGVGGFVLVGITVAAVLWLLLPGERFTGSSRRAFR